MNCEEARATLWPPERPKLLGGDVAKATEHVANCEACTEYFQQDRALLDVWERAREVQAPKEVRERVFDALAAERFDSVKSRDETLPEGDDISRWSGLRRVALPLATAAFFGAVLFTQMADRTPSADEGAEMFVEDYLRRAVGEDHIETTDPGEVTRFLERELGIRVEPIDLPGLDVARAEICLLEGRRGAMIVYKQADGDVLHYVLPQPQDGSRDPALSTRSGTAPDMPVVTWATTSSEQALVGGDDADRLLRIAAEGLRRSP